MSNAMTTASIKTTFADAGLKVRVRNLKHKFRICPLGNRDFPHDEIARVANSLGMTDSLGRTIGWSAFNGTRELCAYIPGAIVRI